MVTFTTMFIHQMDVVTAFLNEKLDEEIYMDQLEDFKKPGKERFVCQLQKSLYGLKQSPRCWNGQLGEFLTFKRVQSEPGRFMHVPSYE